MQHPPLSLSSYLVDAESSILKEVLTFGRFLHFLGDIRCL